MSRDKYNVEYTDTFGGEANYSWVKRATIELAALPHDNIYTSAATIAKQRRNYNRELARKAKASVGLTGVRGRSYHYGDDYEFRPYNSATVLFATYDDN